MFVGFDHLNQLANGKPQAEVFSPKKQAELARLNAALKRFAPDLILVEMDPKTQPRLDSLFRAYRAGSLKLNELEGGRNETYQVGFALGKLLDHARIFAVDSYDATSQSLLNKGENIDLFKQGLQKLQATARPLKKAVQADSLSLYEYVVAMNQPEMIQLTHRLFYNLPAVVIHGDFSESGTHSADLSKIDKAYIGAEYISLFYKRNLKIYANILNTQLQNRGRKLLVIMGQTHVGVLQDLVKDNPDYSIVSPLTYLVPKK
ncbi:DUF5694 domain-containing protein [Larkinella humicola]|uniref:TraB family protein n=1 Tax=Larkinella humicola TaxID=2607654 RepID=A0A5N1JQ76_9BACT|nr:DUF5694 domain-containing protein [Larkinella humicola]KAA9356462.1 hypothetical protein F0P93_01535 [Larkinella humicola]